MPDIFAPESHVSVTVHETSTRQAFKATGGACLIRIVTPSGAQVRCRFGGDDITADSSDMPLLANSTEIFTLQSQHTSIAFISASGDVVIDCTVGRGA